MGRSTKVGIHSPVKFFARVSIAVGFMFGSVTATAQTDQVSHVTDSDITDAMRRFIFDASPEQRTRAVQALRKLNDPSLRSLFAQIATGDDPVLRLQGMLGIAELRDERSIDSLLLRRIADPGERARILAEILRHNLISPDDLRDLSRWPDVDPAVRVLVAGELQRRGDEVDPSTFRSYLADDDAALAPAVAVFAALQLAELGDATFVDRTFNRVMALESREREHALGAIISHIIEWKVASGDVVLSHIIDLGGMSPLLRFQALRALLQVQPESQIAAGKWTGAFEEAEGSGEKVRLAVAALEAAGAERVALVQLFQTIGASDDELLAAIAGAGKAAVTGEELQERVIELIDRRHPPTMNWAIAFAGDSDLLDQALVAKRCLVACGASSNRSGRLHAVAIEAARILTTCDLDDLGETLEDARQLEDIPLVEAMLLGAIQSENDEVARLAEYDDWPSPLSGALATLIRVRYGGEITEETRQTLHAFVLGRGKLPPALRVQAGWLAIRSDEGWRTSLARLLLDP